MNLELDLDLGFKFSFEKSRSKIKPLPVVSRASRTLLTRFSVTSKIEVNALMQMSILLDLPPLTMFT